MGMSDLSRLVVIIVCRRGAIQHTTLLLIKFVRKAVINLPLFPSLVSSTGRAVPSRAVAPREALCTLFAQVLLKKNGVSRVALVNGIRKITNKRHQSDGEVNDHIHHHHPAQSRRKSTLNTITCSDHHHGKGGVTSIADTITEISFSYWNILMFDDPLTMERDQSHFPSQTEYHTN